MELMDMNSIKRSKRFYKFCLHQIKKIDPVGNRVKKILGPAPRSGHRIVIFKGNVYAFGGYSPRNPDTDEIINPPNHRHLFKELWKFNSATKTWTNLTTSGVMPAELASHSAVIIENYMLVFGGTGVPFGHSSSNSTHLCNLDSLEWFTLSTSGNKPPPLYGQAIALHKEKMYVIGGTTGYDYTISVHCLDLHTKEWTRLDDTKKQSVSPSPRYRHEIVVFDDSIFVFGGGTVFESCGFMEIPVFNLSDLTWCQVETTSTATVYPEPRLCHGLIQMGDDVFICGGHNGRTIFSDIWKLNLKQLQWTKLNVEMPLPLYFHSVALSEDGQVFIFGGVTNTQEEIRTNEIFSVWLKIPSLSDMCWQALLTYIPHIAHFNKPTLLKAGVPQKYLERIEFCLADPNTKLCCTFNLS